jgi:hypothetical protein
MAFDYLSLAQDVKGTIFDTSRTEYVPREPKEVVAESLRQSLAAFREGKTRTRLYRTSGSEVALTVKYGNHNVALANGRTGNRFPRDQFDAVLEAVIADVERGSFDRVLGNLQADFKANLAKARAAQAATA